MWKWSSNKYKNLSSQDLLKDIKNLSKKKSFLRFLNKKNAHRYINTDSPEIYNALYYHVTQFNNQEKEAYYKYYLNILNRHDFENVFIKQNRGAERVRFYFSKKYGLDDSEIYSILYELNSGFKDINDKKMVDILFEQRSAIYPVLNKELSYYLLNKLYTQPYSSDNKIINNVLITSGMLRFPEIKAKFLKEIANPVKNLKNSFLFRSIDEKEIKSILLVSWLINRSEETNDKYFNDLVLCNKYQLSVDKIIEGIYKDKDKDKDKDGSKAEEYCQHFSTLFTEVSKIKNIVLQNEIKAEFVNLLGTTDFIKMKDIDLLFRDYNRLDGISMFYTLMKKLKDTSSDTLVDDIKIAVNYSIRETPPKYIYSNVNDIARFFEERKFFLLQQNKIEIWNYWLHNTKHYAATLSAIICNKDYPLQKEFILAKLTDFLSKEKKTIPESSIMESPLIDAFFYKKITQEEFCALLKKYLCITKSDVNIRIDIEFYKKESEFYENVSTLIAKTEKEILNTIFNIGANEKSTININRL